MGEIGDLPVELIIAVLRQLRDEDYNLHLKRLSLVNKFFRDITNLRLWRSLRLTDEGLTGPKRPIHSACRRWLQKYRDVASAITHDPCRAGCVHTLHIDLGESQLPWAMCLGTIVRILETILTRLPALQSLQFSVSTTPYGRTHIGVPAIASFLSKAIFPFRLTHFKFPMPILMCMAPFLRKQNAIERLVTIPHEHGQAARLLALARVPSLPTLSHLQHCEGSPLFVRAMIRGRALRSVILACRNLEQERWALLHKKGTEPPTCVDVVGVKGFAQGNFRPLAYLISNLCGISLISIKHLALRDYGTFSGSLHFTILHDFPQLQSLEYERGSLLNRFPARCTVAKLERYCPTLRRALVHYTPNQTFIEFIRKDSLNSDIIDEVWETAMWGGEAGRLHVHADVRGSNGSLWTVRSSEVLTMVDRWTQSWTS